MNVNRLAFLALATSIATAACSSGSEADVDVDEGAATASDGAKCLAVPLEGAIDTASCRRLATEAEKVGEHAPSVQGVCESFLTNFKQSAAQAAQKCMEPLRPESGGAGSMFDWEKLYGCGFDTLASVCESNDVKSECDGLVTRLKPSQKYTHDGSSDVNALKSECMSALSGIKNASRAKVLKCVSDTSYPLYSCIEGMDVNDRGKCTDPKGPATRTRAQIRAACGSLGQAKELCLQFTEASRVAIADNIATEMKKLVDAGTTDLNKLHAKGVAGLRTSCADPEGVDLPCAVLLEKYSLAEVTNAGGRVTRECRALFPGLLKKARDRVLAADSPKDGRIATAIVAMPSKELAEGSE